VALRDQLPPDLFIELHVRQNMSLTNIGEKFGVSRQRVHQLKKEYEKKFGEINRRTFIDFITLKKYLEKGWSDRQIASHFQMKPSKISRLIRKHQERYENGLSPVPLKRKRAEDILSKAILVKLYVVELQTDKEIANHYQLSPSTVNSLRKKYNIPTNNDKSLRKLPIELTREKMEKIANKHTCSVASLIDLKKRYGLKNKKTS
jgi:transposase